MTHSQYTAFVRRLAWHVGLIWWTAEVFHQQQIQTPHRPLLKSKPEFLEERYALFNRSRQSGFELPL